ncbi:probable bifunctional dTTP/UTP pyrophosphatase/methyltransferase protein isoform X2 [Neofelis nebulosa]|uniref:probable bifunctional dTTP/UTP pyrophosphatase/methyltransferase protein isoform X2 n=1 Tax=Neofelis nebulosa TaxID=61452 RepID=UPI00272A33DB|nr:probable bifunctional dTTP/UTP pyrophosphatase/methyltransferase protein isoform X2 [Neofelis nebulosa]
MVLSPVIGKLLHKRVVLASASPRRREILSQAGLRFEVVPSRFKEKLDKAAFATPYAYAIETAKQKALEVASRMHQKDLRAPDVVIGADTIVTIGGLILEKPADKQDAYRMLSRLNGKEHSVFTGVAIIHCCSEDGQLDTDVCEFHEETTVKFSELSEDLLWEYIDSGEPMDKAGGYGIQALGGMLVEYVRGDFLNVVGFPLNHFCKKLVQLYCPPHREDVQRVKHDSIPAVDTFEIASEAAQGDEGCGPSRAGVHGHTGQAPAGPQGPDTNGLVENPPPFPSDLLDLIDGFKASKALFTACKLKVFDVLKEEGPLKAVDVARKLNASVCGTGRLLDVCVALGLLEKTDTGYGNTQLASRHLASEGACSLHGFVAYNDEHAWTAFTDLESAVRQGPRAAAGRPAEDPSQSRDRRLRFMRAMHGLTQLTARQVATAFDLSRFTSACDLGGCTGALARELAREYPRLKVTVFDLPEVIEHVSSFHPEGRQPERLRFVPGDFFKDDLPDAQLYILSRILHDWADDRVHELLSRVSRSCKPDAHVPGSRLWTRKSPTDVCGLHAPDAHPCHSEEAPGGDLGGRRDRRPGIGYQSCSGAGQGGGPR